jgi:hypothetical protein
VEHGVGEHQRVPPNTAPRSTKDEAQSAEQHKIISLLRCYRFCPVCFKGHKRLGQFLLDGLSLRRIIDVKAENQTVPFELITAGRCWTHPFPVTFDDTLQDSRAVVAAIKLEEGAPLERSIKEIKKANMASQSRT